VQRRNDEEFAAFVAASHERLRRTAYLICGDWHRASDITQEALIRVYVAWPRLDKRGGLASYARRAVVNVSIDQSRKRSSTEVPAANDERVASPYDLAGEISDRQALLQALGTLPPRQRACVVLRYFEDLPVAEVAGLLHVSEGTVKSQTARALDTLRARVASQTHEELVVTGEGGH
jgi:RNA polymerase sigma-70 factor (sigma-E family)